MPNLQELLMELGKAILPSGIELVMILISVVGMLIFANAMYGTYQLALNGPRRASGNTGFGGQAVRMLIGAAMTMPSVMFWRAADAYLAGGTTTYSTVLSYVSGIPETGYCDQFKGVVTQAFFAVGLVALFVFFMNVDDQARGMNPRGLRQGIPWLVGAIGCMFISDIVDIASNTLDIDTGFDKVCIQLGSP